MAYEISSPLHQQVLQRIEEERRLGQVVGDSTHRRVHRIPFEHYRPFIGDPDMDDGHGDRARPDSGQRLDVPSGLDVVPRRVREEA